MTHFHLLYKVANSSVGPCPGVVVRSEPGGPAAPSPPSALRSSLSDSSARGLQGPFTKGSTVWSPPGSASLFLTSRNQGISLPPATPLLGLTPTLPSSSPLPATCRQSLRSTCRLSACLGLSLTTLTAPDLLRTPEII